MLASLRSVRSNFTVLANVSTPTVKYVSLKRPRGRREPAGHKKKKNGLALFRRSPLSGVCVSPRATLSDQQYQQLALDTLEELDWCLDQLETIQTHRSVSEMASNKVPPGASIGLLLIPLETVCIIVSFLLPV